MSAMDPIEPIRQIAPAPPPAPSGAAAPATFAQTLQQARSADSAQTTAPAVAAAAATPLPAPAVPAADTVDTAAVTTAQPLSPTITGLVDPVRYSPYAQSPQHSLPEPEPPGAYRPQPVPDVAPTLAVSATALGQPRDWRESNARYFLNFVTYLTNAEQAAARSPASQSNRRRPVARVLPHWSPTATAAANPDTPRTSPDPPPSTMADWFAAHGYDEERFGGIFDMLHFNVAAFSFIAAANGVVLPDGFLTDPAYLDMTDSLKNLGAVRGGEAVYAAMRTYFSPARVAMRTVDFAVSLSPATLPGERREYASAVMHMVGRAHQRTLAAPFDILQSRPLLRRASRLIERWLNDFIRSGPDPEKSEVDGLYDRLRTWAGAGRMFYHRPKKHNTDIMAKNLSLTGLKPTIDSVV